MKIVATSNFNEDLYKEKVIAENVSEIWGKELVNAWNTKYCSNDSLDFLILVNDDYELYNGYEDLL